MNKAAFAFTHSCGMPMIVAWFGNDRSRCIRQHYVLTGDNARLLDPDNADKLRKEFNESIPPCDVAGILVGGVKFPFQRLSFNFDEMAIKLDSGMTEVSDEVYREIERATRQGNWTDFDDESWMK